MYGHEARPPDYLALLVSATQAADKLEIEDSGDFPVFGSDAVYSCLMSGLLIQNGLKTLCLNVSKEISTYQTKLLFEGVAHSSCLETLELAYVSFEDPEVATNAFVHALKKNRSLKVLDLDDTFFARFQDIFRIAILDTEIRSITTSEERDPLDFQVVLDVLSSEDCQLQSLAFYNTDLRFGDLEGDPTKTNASVNDVTLVGAELVASSLTSICSGFKSLKKLVLEGNHLSDLSPLDTLLLGDNLTLQYLSLSCCDIDQNTIFQFLQKLPQMKCIRRIDLDGNPFLDSHEWKDVLSNAIRRNSSLERLYLGFEGESLIGDCIFLWNIEVALGLNRAWRQHMENDTGENTARAVLPSALWPVVLERASKMPYFACKTSTNASMSWHADVAFWLLRHRMVTELT